ncbi:hypothetical protein GALMADRAFT_238528, partial [Galerina marginata CBS 339.88]
VELGSSSMIKWQFREQWIRYKSEICVKQKRHHRKDIDVVTSEKNGEIFFGRFKLGIL